MINHLKTTEINEQFSSACKNGDLSTVINLYNNYFLKQRKNYFKYFLKITGLKITELDLELQKIAPFSSACANGHKEIVQFFLDTPELKNAVNLGWGLYSALEHRQLDIAEIMTSCIQEKDNLFYRNLVNTLIDFAQQGNLEAIKFIITDKELNFHNYSKYYTEMDEEETGKVFHRVFFAACQELHFDIIKYLMNSPDVKKFIDVEEFNSLGSFTSSVIKKITDFEQLQQELNSKSQSIQAKKIKI